jgi:hypothetical protein
LSFTSLRDVGLLRRRRPREGGGPSGALERKTLGSRFRGNDEVLQIVMEFGDVQ